MTGAGEHEALTPDAFGKLIEPMLDPATASAQTLIGLQPRSVEQWLPEMLA